MLVLNGFSADYESSAGVSSSCVLCAAVVVAVQRATIISLQRCRRSMDMKL